MLLAGVVKCGESVSSVPIKNARIRRHALNNKMIVYSQVLVFLRAHST